MRPARARRERGAALLALLAVLLLGASWLLVSQLNAESAGVTAVNRAHNAAALNRAKQALIGYVAMQAAESGERNPGRLPCPEGVSYAGVAASEGIAWNGFGTDCATVGRLPWRTLGLEKLLDASSEPLWYVVGPAWRLSSSTSNLVINSNTTGDITLDGQTVVALIIAPGPAMDAQAATGCSAKNQIRSAPASTIDATNYLECFDATTRQFTTTASSSSYNDQVVRITVADIMPAIEAAIANRIEREILPALMSVYTPATWGFSGSNPVLPLAAPFGNPGTASYQGATSECVANVCKGLLPFFRTVDCIPATDPRCTASGPPFFVFSKPVSYVDTAVAGSGSVRTSSDASTCVWQSNVYVCTGEYNAPSISVSVSVNVTNVYTGLRALDSSKITCAAVDDVGNGIPIQSVTCSASVALQSDGSAILTVVTSALPDIAASGWGTYANYKINIDPAAIGDHSLLSTTNATTGWFARNEWYRFVYYAVAASNTAPRLPLERSCVAAADCVPLTTNTSTSSKSALLILAGRSVNGVTRPSGTLTDYFEFGNAKGSFENQSVSPVAALIYADTGTADAYSVAVASLATGESLQFKAANANTGASTLTTPATGARTLANPDGSALAAAAVQANAAVQVTWDGTQFLLSKRPFNDRVVAIGSN